MEKWHPGHGAIYKTGRNDNVRMRTKVSMTYQWNKWTGQLMTHRKMATAPMRIFSRLGPNSTPAFQFEVPWERTAAWRHYSFGWDSLKACNVWAVWELWVVWQVWVILTDLGRNNLRNDAVCWELQRHGCANVQVKTKHWLCRETKLMLAGKRWLCISARFHPWHVPS